MHQKTGSSWKKDQGQRHRSERFKSKNLSTPQKGAGDITLALFLSPIRGDNIHFIFISYGSGHAPTSSLLWCHDLK